MQPHKKELGQPALCSGKKTASDLIATGPSFLTSVIIKTDGTNDVTVVIYDNTSASGKIIREFTVTGSDNCGGNTIPFPVLLVNGIYVTVSGTGGSYIIDYIN